MIIEYVRLSEKAKQQLITLKRRTGIDNWNILCRWAFCLSLKETSVPPHEDIITDSSIEMSWKVFSGEYSELYENIFKMRIYRDYGDVDNKQLSYYFRLHLHRGISYLLNQVNTLDDLVKIASKCS
ncbi:DNA sulfur modification protein DndE [Enterobacter bugandensis]|uniref:DNA sulfur modification protein DndE n=1 Tax=Enterobacter bugandensis TaxID=881260 RepID=UPI0020064CEC|nr:DNA sulfur modification protein DndE [Enterobacter bugandensis]MCK6735241.1 DNA sulfur modification protein DndE [Enterobacter bugandensis]MCK7313166.1 DNA sulfur modification protein DndE [Enterobacter bugandensis]HCM9226517.1 DNA sulfur modification protein DndE [Enterobacter bugandensis]HCM9228225.1 DNA sulfur modification protein DndE [Enterobacter bugandensis]